MSNVAVLREMAKLTMLSNKLNDIQLKNLQMFPLVFFEGVNSVKIEYDLSNNLEVDSEENSKDLDIKYNFNTSTKHLFVSYFLDLKEDAHNDNLDKRFEAIETSVRGIFWPEVKVLVHFGDKRVYESKS